MTESVDLDDSQESDLGAVRGPGFEARTTGGYTQG
jgi:hypothetical protein